MYAAAQPRGLRPPPDEPARGYTLFGNADFNFNEHVTAYSVISFANSKTETRREPAPTSGAFAVAIPYHSDPNAMYLPSIAQTPAPGIAIGDTLAEYRAGGKRGFNCRPIGGCTMQQAFPVTPEMRTLLNSRPDVQLSSAAGASTSRGPATSPVQRPVGLRAAVASTRTPPSMRPHGAGGRGERPSRVHRGRWTPTPARPSRSAVRTRRGACRTSCTYLPPRGTVNDITNYQFTGGFRGDLGLADWTWDTFVSHGESRTSTQYVGYISALNYYTHHDRAELRQGLQRAEPAASRTRPSPARAASIRLHRRPAHCRSRRTASKRSWRTRPIASPCDRRTSS